MSEDTVALAAPLEAWVKVITRTLGLVISGTGGAAGPARGP